MLTLLFHMIIIIRPGFPLDEVFLRESQHGSAERRVDARFIRNLMYLQSGFLNRRLEGVGPWQRRGKTLYFPWKTGKFFSVVIPSGNTNISQRLSTTGYMLSVVSIAKK